MTVKIERLVGSDHDVARIVDAARRFVPAERRDAWVQAVAGMARMRAELRRAMADAGARPRSAPAAGGRAKAPALWWSAYVIGIVAAFAGAAVMLPPKGRGGQDPVLMTAVAQTSLVLGAVLLIVVVILPLPAAVRGSSTAVALAVMPVPFLLFAGVLNVVRFDELRDAVGTTAIAVVGVAGVVCAGLCVVMFVRVRASAPVRRRRTPSTDPKAAADFATRIARELPYGRAVREAWLQELEALAPPAPEAVARQAGDLGPFAYIVWAYYDGERELPRPETLRGH
ncbi:hypothetical protein ACLKM7_13110 [Microbacterium sp. I2]|uniref:hypothetical protein n=1 Tax=Microbacterium sp. I2 TaxID=3391826 RepID=UPI003EDB224F